MLNFDAYALPLLPLSRWNGLDMIPMIAEAPVSESCGGAVDPHVTEGCSIMLRRILVFVGSLVLVSGAFAFSDKEESSPLGRNDPIKYETEENPPKDQIGEKRRDYAVLEAALEDLARKKRGQRKGVRTIYWLREVDSNLKRDTSADEEVCEDLARRARSQSFPRADRSMKTRSHPPRDGWCPVV
jgi:hypothetical protein